MIKVSVFCLAFNQRIYIEQALDSMLMQETDFDYEILINDDCSNDGTKEIIREYQKKYPGKIKSVFHKENQYSKGKRSFILRYLIPKAKGQYFAICEGDDYWTDPRKLQKQVDFLDRNPDYTLCFHKVIVKYENNEKKDIIYPDVEDPSWYTKDELIRTNYIQTNSVMYRRLDYANAHKTLSPADWYLHLFHAHYGKIKFMDEVMSVYRKHSKGIWWEYDLDRDKVWRTHGKNHLNMWLSLLEVYVDKNNYIEIIYEKIYQMVDALARVDNKYKEEIIADIQRAHPEVINNYIHYSISKQDKFNRSFQKDREAYAKLEDEYKKLKEQQVYMKNEYNIARAKLDAIHKSRIWKFRNKLAKLLNRQTL